MLVAPNSAKQALVSDIQVAPFASGLLVITNVMHCVAESVTPTNSSLSPVASPLSHEHVLAPLNL